MSLFCSKNLGQVDLRYWVTMIWKWSHILLHFAATQHCNKVAYIFHWRKFDIFTLFKILAKIIRKRHKEHLISIFTINVRLEDMPMKYTSDRERLVSKQYSIYNEISRFYILVSLSSTAFNPLLQLPSWTLWSKWINLILFHENDIFFMKTIFCKGLVEAQLVSDTSLSPSFFLLCVDQTFCEFCLKDVWRY